MASKVKKKKEKPLYLRDYQISILSKNNSDELHSNEKLINKKNEENSEECEKIKEKIKINSHNEYINDDEFFVCKEKQSFNNTDVSSSSVIKSKNDKVNEIDFINDFINNKKYLFKEDQNLTPHESTDEDDDTKMNISYPRNVKSSRIHTNKRCQKRKNHLQNKILKKQKVLKNFKINKKNEILHKLQLINNHNDNTNTQSQNDNESEILDDENIKISKRELKKIKRKQKVEDRQKKKYNDKNTIDDYNIHCEDVIDDIPVKYHYQQCIPNSYGLTPEEIVLCDEKELNKWCSMQKVLQIKDEENELKLSNMYNNRSKNHKIKMRILKSLYNFNNDKIKNQKSTIKSTNRKKLLHKYFNKATQSIVQDISTNRLLSYNLKNDLNYNK